MEWVKLNLPETFAFNTTITIRITDVNYGGHVGNDVFLSLIHEARLQFYKHFNYTEINLEGIGTIMADVAMEYKAELFYGDVVEIAVTVANIGRVGFDIFYLLEKNVGENKQVVAKAKTGILCYNYATKKVVSVPITAKEKFQQV